MELYSGLWSEVSTRQTLESFIQPASKTRGTPAYHTPTPVLFSWIPHCHTAAAAAAAAGQSPLPLPIACPFFKPLTLCLSHINPSSPPIRPPAPSSEQAMCPRATTAQQRGDAMASVCSFVEEEYIDLDLSSCGEFEFRVRRSGAPDELLCRGRLQPPPPDKAAPPRPGGKAQEVDVGGGGRRSTATVAPLQHSHSAGCRDDVTVTQQPVARLRTECSRRRKAARTVHAKLLASRAFFRSLFARTSCSDEQCRGAEVRASTRAVSAPPGETKSTSCKAAFSQIKNGYGYHSGSGRAAPTTLRSSIEQEKLMDEEELAAASAAARQRKSFSGVIKWRHAAATTTTAAAPPAAAPSKPLSSSSARRSSCSWVGGVGGPALKRSSSARSESEGLIQGAIAYCKRSQQQLGLARKSVSDAAAFCSASAPSAWPSNPARSAAVAYCH